MLKESLSRTNELEEVPAARTRGRAPGSAATVTKAPCRAGFGEGQVERLRDAQQRHRREYIDQ
jgi:hypothetical protein